MAGHISDEDSENITREDPSMKGPRGSRSVIESGHPSIKNIMTGNQITKAKHQLSGMKGCWFKSKVIQLMLGDLTGEGKVLLLDLIFVEALIFREVNLKMTASIDIKSNNNTFLPPVRPPSIHCSSYFKRLVKIILQKLGPNCEVSGASHAQSIKAYNSVERNPFLLTKKRLTYRPLSKIPWKTTLSNRWVSSLGIQRSNSLSSRKSSWRCSDLPEKKMEQVNDFNNQLLPLSRIKKIKKADNDARLLGRARCFSGEGLSCGALLLEGFLRGVNPCCGVEFH
ncbi:hypothetical protein KY285_020509 [Solanum tuberosum]|nr:hypothetical protein KY285_020509 [Solanum tuberosum]